MTEIATGVGLYRLLDTSLRPVIHAVGLSLGPYGRTVLYERGGPLSIAAAGTGFSIACEMPMPTGLRGAAPRLLKETLFAADRDLGDGTARLALIAGACFSAGIREILSGAGPEPLCEAIARSSEEFESWLVEERAPEVNFLHIARSSGVSEMIAEKLASLMQELGSDATIDVKENSGSGIELTKSEGFVLDAKPIGGEALSSLSSASVLVADEIIHHFGSLAAVLEGFANKRKPLVIVARDITGSALATLKRNQQADIVTVAALQPADAGQRAADCLEDLAVATGATLIAERLGSRLEGLRPSMLGQAGEFRFADGRAIFLGPRGKPEEIALRRRMLSAATEKARYLSYDREFLERRHGRLGGQWCELRIAGDSVHATRALITSTRAALRSMQSAARNGAVAGGGALFARLSNRLAAKGSPQIAASAARVLSQGLLTIPHQLSANAGPGETASGQEDEAVQDPLQLTKAIINQGFGLATILLRTGAMVAR